MEPNFFENEYLIIDEITYRFSEPKRGDIVVFRYPNEPQEYFIKRIIGLPGETIDFENGNIYIKSGNNSGDESIKEPYLSEGIKTYPLRESSYNLSQDEYFVLGDNRNVSKDSRTFGPVNKSFLIGRVLLRGWPFNRFGLLVRQDYQY